ncbi:MAG: hypothetical protein EBQ96_03245 [Proteobacteria bacterium]|nr:hypothetical protein [Pseudomonadota bacterium]
MMDRLTATADPALSRLIAADTAMLQAKNGLSAKKISEIDSAAKDFETMFLSEMVAHMFDTVAVDPLFGGGEAEETWRGLMVDEYSKAIVKAGGFGMSDSVKTHMISLQEELNK